MLVACLWSHRQEGEESLLSFAAITDEPPAEVAAAGHDRCIIPIKPENPDAWLDPQRDIAAAYEFSTTAGGRTMGIGEPPEIPGD